MLVTASPIASPTLHSFTDVLSSVKITDKVANAVLESDEEVYAVEGVAE